MQASSHPGADSSWAGEPSKSAPHGTLPFLATHPNEPSSRTPCNPRRSEAELKDIRAFRTAAAELAGDPNRATRYDLRIARYYQWAQTAATVFLACRVPTGTAVLLRSTSCVRAVTLPAAVRQLTVLRVAAAGAGCPHPCSSPTSAVPLHSSVCARLRRQGAGRGVLRGAAAGAGGGLAAAGRPLLCTRGGHGAAHRKLQVRPTGAAPAAVLHLLRCCVACQSSPGASRAVADGATPRPACPCPRLCLLLAPSDATPLPLPHQPPLPPAGPSTTASACSPSQRASRGSGGAACSRGTARVHAACSRHTT